MNVGIILSSEDRLGHPAMIVSCSDGMECIRYCLSKIPESRYQAAQCRLLITSLYVMQVQNKSLNLQAFITGLPVDYIIMP